MKKKGFTLIEVLAVIVILGIVAAITTAVVFNYITKSKKDAFENSVYAAIKAYINSESYNDFNDLGEVDITTLPLDNNPMKSGIVKRNDSNEVVVINATDGMYCANGSKNNLSIVKGNCE